MILKSSLRFVFIIVSSVNTLSFNVDVIPDFYLLAADFRFSFSTSSSSETGKNLLSPRKFHFLFGIPVLMKKVPVGFFFFQLCVYRAFVVVHQ
ncbi:MAG: hypothetical protein I8H68_08045 [Flavobacteriia bacterium]|nr:hypothetical protein [Flavobacteriia bacterium]